MNVVRASFASQLIWGRYGCGHVIPIYLDETKFVGIPSDIVGIKYSFDPSKTGWENDVIDKIVFRLIERIS